MATTRMTPPKMAAQEIRWCMCVPTGVTVSTVAEGDRESYALVDKNFSSGGSRAPCSR
jgi:hypothetical protein